MNCRGCYHCAWRHQLGVTKRRRTAGAGPQNIAVAGPKTVRIRLLGSFSVSVGDRTIEQSEWRLKKVASLIKLLALAPAHQLHREQLMDLLWPDLWEEGSLKQPPQSSPLWTQDPRPGCGLALPGKRGRATRVVPARRSLGGCGGLRASGNYSPSLATSGGPPGGARLVCRGAIADRSLRAVDGGQERGASAAVPGPPRQTRHGI